MIKTKFASKLWHLPGRIDCQGDNNLNTGTVEHQQERIRMIRLNEKHG
jgi:hypothetical protein